MNEELIKRIIELEKNHEEEKISDILEEKLQQDPENVDLLFRMAMLNIYTPFADYTTCCLFFEKVIEVSKKYQNIANIFIKYGGRSYFTDKYAYKWIFEPMSRDLISDSVKPLLDQIFLDGSRNNIPEETKKFIEDALVRDPKNIEMLFLLAAIELPDKSKTLLKTIIKISKENEAMATVFMAYIVNHGYFIDEVLLNRLAGLYTDNPEINSMIKYAISWFYLKNKDQAMEEKYLKESINLYQGHVRNYERLAQLYKKQGRGTEANELIKKAQANVKKVYEYGNDRQAHDPTDVNELLGELVKGIYVTSMGSVSL